MDGRERRAGRTPYRTGSCIYPSEGQHHKQWKRSMFSNVIELPNVLISKSTSSLTPPKTMFIVGSMLDTDWKVWKPMAGVYGMDGQFYSMIYFDANSEFKFGTKENEYIGN